LLIPPTINKKLIFLSDLFGIQNPAFQSDDITIKYYRDAEKLTINPFLFLKGKHNLLSQLHITTEQSPPELVIEAKNVTLIGHGLVIDAQGRRIVSHSANSEMGRLQHQSNAKLLIDAGEHYAISPALKYRRIDEEVAIISQAGQLVYGHWLVDILPKIAFMESIGFTGRYVLHEPIPDFSKELLKLLAIPLNRIISYNPNLVALYFPKALIPGSLRYRSAFSKGMAGYIKRMSKHAQPAGNKKLFISRAKLRNKNRVLANSHELASTVITLFTQNCLRLPSKLGYFLKPPFWLVNTVQACIIRFFATPIVRCWCSSLSMCHILYKQVYVMWRGSPLVLCLARQPARMTYFLLITMMPTRHLSYLIKTP